MIRFLIKINDIGIGLKKKIDAKSILWVILCVCWRLKRGSQLRFSKFASCISDKNAKKIMRPLGHIPLLDMFSQASQI